MAQAPSFSHFKGCPERQCCPYLDLPDKPDIGDMPSVPTPSPSLMQTRVSCSLRANTESLKSTGWRLLGRHRSCPRLCPRHPNQIPQGQTPLLAVPPWRAALGHSCQNVENKCRKILTDSAVHPLPLDSLVMGAVRVTAPPTVTEINDCHLVYKVCHRDLAPSALR